MIVILSIFHFKFRFLCSRINSEETNKVGTEAKEITYSSMVRARKVTPESSSAMRISTDRRSSPRIGNGRPGLAIVTALLCGPIALITVPAFWLMGLTLTQAALLTIFVQLAIFLVVMMIGLYRSSGDDESADSYSDDPSYATISDLKIWRSHSYAGADVDAPSIALIAEDSVQTRQIAKNLAQQDNDVHQTADVDVMLETVKAHPAGWDFMIFDLDLFDDLETNVDRLVMFRQGCTGIPILLLSGSVTRDEFSDHRRAIGDATLRKPVFHGRLLAGISAMRQNSEAREFV